MITKTNAVGMSIRKWNRDPVDLDDTCGFCEYAKERSNMGYGNSVCEEYCPLYPDICTAEGDEKPNALYWQYHRTRTPELAQQILDAIIERGEKWIQK